MIPVCCMSSCKEPVFCIDLKTKEYLCKEHGEINAGIYHDRGEEINMEVLKDERDN